jgi:uncharacterized circularly permuted ATP-grasp superfamily protein/uncharacterized alpha-E superfamily protein
VLQDLYGFQHLLRDGWLPAPVLYGNPQFLRGCQGVRVPGGNYIPFYAVDLARSPDGKWWVLADRTQAPSGIGFALENRALVSRVLPEALEAVQPKFVGAMLPHIRKTLMGLAQGSDHPNVVVMTPGQRNEAYFEHAYIARLLGFALVEGGDLTVRDRRVFMKTLEGLRPVDVILRRVNDALCDPLELRGDSLLGVPGLLEAVRAGKVTLANALGCGVMESPAMMAFLPNLCRFLLQEELLLPSVATWWCGEPYEEHFVSSNLDRYAVRSAYTLARKPEETRGYSAARRMALREAIHDRPHEYIGQEEVLLSHLPTLSGGGIGASPFVLRVFAVCSGDDVHVMPGGIVRLSDQAAQGSLAVSLTGRNKDVWVLPREDGPDAGAMPLVVMPAPFVSRDALDIPSRTADNLFWLGRYTERLEYLLRTIRCTVRSVTGDFGAIGLRRLGALAELLRRLGLLGEGGEGDTGAHLRDRVASELMSLIHDRNRAGNVVDLIGRIHQAGFAARDRLSMDMWRLLTRMEHKLEGEVGGESGEGSLLEASSTLDSLVLDLAAFSGMEMENMTRGHGWVFLDFGRRLERSLNGLDLLEAAFGPLDAASEEQAAQLMEPVLEICDSVITYRQRHFAEMRLHAVLALLLQERENPRSLAFQLAAMQHHATELPTQPNPEAVAQVRERIASLSSRIDTLDLKSSGHGAPLSLEPLSTCGDQLIEVSELLTQVYFSHVLPMVN